MLEDELDAAVAKSRAERARDKWDFDDPMAVLDRVDAKLENGIDKTVDAALAWQKPVLVDAAKKVCSPPSAIMSAGSC
jgi:hypothetical protein